MQSMIAQSYKNPEVRDLAWACFAPAMMRTEQLSADSQPVGNCGLELTLERQEWLTSLDQNPVPLRDHIAGIRSHRLGIYFEGLWHFFLQQDEQVDLIAHNLPVRDGGVTLGEFDCLYYCHQRGAHFHLELAVKFFLSNRRDTTSDQPSQLREWWGPECQDRLDLKLGHLMNRQIQLADLPPAQVCLSALGIEQIGREVEVKGYLFQSIRDPLSSPDGYNKQQTLNHWVHLEDLAQYTGRMLPKQFITLSKLQWLSPIVAGPGAALLTAEELLRAMQEHFDTDSRPQLVAALDGSGSELDRFFVTGNDWPHGNGERP